MISLLSGTLQEIHPGYIVVQVGGFGIKVFIPASLFFNLPEKGTEITVQTLMLIKDDEAVLYGFSDTEERDFFRIMLSVAGVGPKVALALLGHLTLARLLNALHGEDVHALTTVPGIGTKTAKRIIYELKDKVAGFEQAETGSTAVAAAGIWSTVEEALLGLGYSPKEIARVKGQLEGENGSVEELFKKALALFAR